MRTDKNVKFYTKVINTTFPPIDIVFEWKYLKFDSMPKYYIFGSM